MLLNRMAVIVVIVVAIVVVAVIVIGPLAEMEIFKPQT
jgi:hypothetical protein